MVRELKMEKTGEKKSYQNEPEHKEFNQWMKEKIKKKKISK